MLTFNFSTFPYLETERLVLRDTTVDDANEVFFLRSDEGVMEFIKKEKAKDLDEAIEHIKRVSKTIQENTCISWSMCLKGDNKMIGSIALWRLIPEHHRAEIGYAMHPEYQGKGIMGEAVDAVIKYGFDVMKLHSIEANIDPGNHASRRLLERAGFEQEAYFKEDYYYQGRFYDTATFSLLTPIWQE